MSKVTDNPRLWAYYANKLTDAFRVAVDSNNRDDEFASAWDMMEFLQETVAALKSNGALDRELSFDAGVDFGPVSNYYDGHDGPDKEGWDEGWDD